MARMSSRPVPGHATTPPVPRGRYTAAMKVIFDAAPSLLQELPPTACMWRSPSWKRVGDRMDLVLAMEGS